ncbi:MAG: MFS transporter [Blastocatellales bacterium]|nr:MFS transporter [Blastocatellales bacterium]
MNESAIAASAGRKAYLNIILPLFITSVIAYIDRVNVGYAALKMNADLGFDPAVFGFGAGIFFAGYFLFEIPGALVAEKYSPRLWVARIMLTWGLISGLMAYMTAPWHFYLLRFLLGAAEASLYPVIYATIIPRWFGPHNRARAIAVLLASLQISGVIGAPLAGWLIGIEVLGFKGWQALFLIEAMPAIAFAFIIVYWMADRPEEARWLTRAEKEFLTRRYKTETEAKIAARRYTVMEALRDPEVLKLCLTYFLWVTGFWGFNYWMPTVLKDVSGWSNAGVGRAIAAAMLVSLAASVYTGHSSSKRNERRWHGAVHMFIASAGMIGIVLAQDAWTCYFFVVLTAVGVYAPMSVWWSYPTTFLSGLAAAGAVGMINSFGNLGGFAGPYITGWVRQTTGSFAGGELYMAASLAAAGLLILTLRKQSPVDAAR